MMNFLGYNFCFDKNATDISPTNLNNIRKVKIQNGIFDHYSITRDVTKPYSSAIPTTWDFLTIMDANFEDNLDAGNIKKQLEGITSFKIKRRIVGSFDWVTIAELPINSPDDLKFRINDYFNQNSIEYEYAFVPITGTAEGDYLTNTIMSQFNGVFICDYETIFKFYAGVSYGNMESVQRVGVFEPIGSKYPIIVSNGDTDYHTGSVSGTILNPDFDKTREISREGIVKYRNLLDKFLKNKRAKIIKDWNSNYWLIYITSSPNITFRNEYGMGISDITFDWTEQGDPNNGNDLYENGLVKVVQ